MISRNCCAERRVATGKKLQLSGPLREAFTFEQGSSKHGQLHAGQSAQVEMGRLDTAIDDERQAFG